MSVMRHEGWHAAQDCMAGTIENSMIAIIMNEEDVPEMWAENGKKILMFLCHMQFLGRKKQPGQVRLRV